MTDTIEKKIHTCKIPDGCIHVGIALGDNYGTYTPIDRVDTPEGLTEAVNAIKELYQALSLSVFQIHLYGKTDNIPDEPMKLMDLFEKYDI